MQYFFWNALLYHCWVIAWSANGSVWSIDLKNRIYSMHNHRKETCVYLHDLLHWNKFNTFTVLYLACRKLRALQSNGFCCTDKPAWHVLHTGCCQKAAACSCQIALVEADPTFFWQRTESLWIAAQLLVCQGSGATGGLVFMKGWQSCESDVNHWEHLSEFELHKAY